MRTRMVIALLALLVFSGCGGLRTSISFSSRSGEGDKIISGNVRGSLKKVQEFRSLLEALEYRSQEKPK